MTITYALFRGSTLLSVSNIANSSDEILNVMDELNKLGKGYSFIVTQVETNK